MGAQLEVYRQTESYVSTFICFTILFDVLHQPYSFQHQTGASRVPDTDPDTGGQARAQQQQDVQNQPPARPSLKEAGLRRPLQASQPQGIIDKVNHRQGPLL